MARARVAFDWEKQFALALDPERARQYYFEARENRDGAPTQAASPALPVAPPCGDPNGKSPNEEFCTMCGPKFCAMRTTADLNRLRRENESATEQKGD